MNVLYDPWIPVLWSDEKGGTVEELGVYEILKEAHHIAGLADTSPLGQVPQLRMVLAFLYAIFPVTNSEQWRQLYKGKMFDIKALENYFDKPELKGRLELFGATPFYQAGDGFALSNRTPLGKLSHERDPAEYNQHFSHETSERLVDYSPAEACRMLLIAHTYGLGGGVSSDAECSGVKYTRPNYTDGVTRRGVASWLVGKSLFETLLLNLVPFDDIENADAPCWKRAIDQQYFNSSVHETPQDRFTALTRLVQLVPVVIEGRTVVREMYYAQGRKVHEAGVDPMQRYINGETRSLVRLEKNKATWRDLHALLQINAGDGNEIPNSATTFVGRMVREGTLAKSSKYQIHVAGFAPKGSQAKVLSWRHDSVSLPAVFLDSDNAVVFLGGCLTRAEVGARRVYWSFTPPSGDPKGEGRVYDLCLYYIHPDRDQKEPNWKPNAKAIVALGNAIDPRDTYWALLEQQVTTLLEKIAAINDFGEDTTVTEWWTKEISEAKRRAVDLAIERLGPSPRTWRAAAYKFAPTGKDKRVGK